MPAEPPALKIVGQSSFVDFGENDRDLVFGVCCHFWQAPSVFVCGGDRVTDRSLLNLALTVGIRIVIGQTEDRQ